MTREVREGVTPEKSGVTPFCPRERKPRRVLSARVRSVWATLTTKYYYRRAFTTRDQVYTGVATWIEDFYNRPRIHTSLGGKSPVEYERHQAAQATAA